MTIKDFAQLVGCNPQTLRYYDHVDLLKPVKVDQWSGYRYYEEEQALAFVKIKNLQKAGFSIDEIRGLLDQDDAEICRAFDAKIAEAESRLQEIKEIRQSYQTEMMKMTEMLNTLRTKMADAMEKYDPAEEYGISEEAYREIADRVDQYFEKAIQEIGSNSNFSLLNIPQKKKAEKEFEKHLNDPAYDLVYEKHGWRFVKDFLDEFADLENGGDYALMFRLEPVKMGNVAFANVIISILMNRNEDKDRSLSCHVAETKDGQNHFWLLKKRG